MFVASDTRSARVCVMRLAREYLLSEAKAQSNADPRAFTFANTDADTNTFAVPNPVTFAQSNTITKSFTNTNTVTKSFTNSDA